jgi:hypothetical protein
MANQDIAPSSYVVERDLRLDLFRGIGLLMIFLDHIPDDFVAWLTLRNYGFSDAAEFFVCISGYLAGYIYGPLWRWSSPDIFPVDRRYLPLNGCVRWSCAVSIRCRFFASAYSCPLERIGFWFSTPRAALARSGCNCSSASAAS